MTLTCDEPSSIALSAARFACSDNVEKASKHDLDEMY